jgi:hypothetical protein
MKYVLIIFQSGVFMLRLQITIQERLCYILDSIRLFFFGLRSPTHYGDFLEQCRTAEFR